MECEKCGRQFEKGISMRNHNGSRRCRRRVWENEMTSRGYRRIDGNPSQKDYKLLIYHDLILLRPAEGSTRSYYKREMWVHKNVTFRTPV